MTKIRNYFIIFASVFAISSACALVGVQDVKAQEGPALSDLIKRIEALESKPGGGGNVSAGILNSIDGMKIGFDLRHRLEVRSDMVKDGTDFGLGSTSFDSSNGRLTRAAAPGQAGASEHQTKVGRAETSDFTLQRFRLNILANVNRNVRAYLQLQDVRAFGDEGGTTGNLEATDLQQGYVELLNLGDLGSLLNNFELRIGRWAQAYGNQRLIGALGWANQSRAYDGARLRWASNGNWVDLFANQINEKETGGASGQTRLSKLDIDEVLYGVYTHFKVMKGIVAEPYGIVRARSAEDTQSPITSPSSKTGEQRYTAGFRLAGKNMSALPGVDFTIEPAWQFGKVEGLRSSVGTGVVDYGRGESNSSNVSNSIQAFAIHAEAGYTFKNLPWTPRIGYAYSFASGDDRPNAGSAKTFDHLYPTGHAHNGYMDITGWQNIRDHQIHLNFKPTKKLVCDAKLHFMSVDEEADALYSVGGGTGWGGGRGVTMSGADSFTRNGVTSSLDDDVGQELDITLKYKLFKNFGVVAGYSHFWVDDWIEDQRGGNDTGIDWMYLQTTVKF